MDESRRYKRRNLLAEVRIRPREGGLWLQAVLTNIHRGGVGVYAMGALKKKEKVSVRITYLEDGRQREIEEIPGIVRWVQPIGESSAAGIMFDAVIGPKTFPLLTRCLKYIRKAD